MQLGKRCSARWRGLVGRHCSTRRPALSLHIPAHPAQVVESRSRECNPDDAGDFGAIRVSTLTLVDLAGSERIAKTGGWRMELVMSTDRLLVHAVSLLEGSVLQ